MLRDLPDADSIHLLLIVARLELSLGVECDDEGLFAVRTVGDLVDLLAATRPS